MWSKKFLLLLITILKLLSFSGAILNNEYSKQRKLTCLLNDHNDFSKLQQIGQNGERIDIWEESGEAFPLRVTMRVPMELQAELMREFTCTCQPLLHFSKPPVLKALADFFSDYRSHDQILTYLNNLPQRQPKRVLKVESMGKSGEGRDMPVVMLGKADGKSASRKNIWISCGQHAREWIASAACLYLVEQVIKMQDEQLEKTLDAFNFFIAPLINPDGYEYSRQTDRYWRKNRTKNSDGSFGTDLNRNWNVKWGEIGTSRQPASDIYCGSAPESEPEVRNVVKYVLALPNRVAGLDVHSYGQKVLRNYGYTTEDTPVESIIRPIGNLMAARAGKKYRQVYSSEKSAALYPTGGGCDDWFYLVAKMYGFTLELRDRGSFGFTLPAAQIKPTGEELAQMIIALASLL